MDPMIPEVFRFRQFELHQHGCAMKVGTDGVLLGAWSPVSGAVNVLDIGTGTGVVALMMAQRSHAQITAIEPDQLAASRAHENFATSPNADRVTLVPTTLQAFHLPENAPRFDLMTCNPPYFDSETKPSNPARLLARHAQTLSPKDLMMAASHLLAKNGALAVVLPCYRESTFVKAALENGFYIRECLYVSSIAGRPPIRVLLEWRRGAGSRRVSYLAIQSESGQFTPEYLALVSDYLFLS